MDSARPQLEHKGCCGKKLLTGNAKSLLTTACLFFTITALQYIASLPRFANSLALRADCLSMFVDGLSYLGNLAAECYQEEKSKKCVELSVAGISLTVLLGFTVMFFFESLHEALSKKKNEHRTLRSISKESNDDVDPQIVVFFAVLGLVFDSISLATFKLCAGRDSQGNVINHDRGDSPDNNLPSRVSDERCLALEKGCTAPESSPAILPPSGPSPPPRSKGAMAKDERVRVDDGGGGGGGGLGQDSLPTGSEVAVAGRGEGKEAVATPPLPNERRRGSRNDKNQEEDDELEESDAGVVGGLVDPTDINMLSALLHVGSDLLRSLTTLVEGVVIMTNPRIASSHVDGFAALAVCGIIAAGAVGALVKWVRALEQDLVLHFETSLLALTEVVGGGGPERSRDGVLYRQVSSHEEEELELPDTEKHDDDMCGINEGGYGSLFPERQTTEAR